MAEYSILRNQERGQVNAGWLLSYHSFSFGRYYNQKWMGFGPLRVINDDTIKGGGGFATHPHNNMEIISYVTAGALAHKDSMGHEEVIRAGEVQMMSAGTGVTHSEYNASPSEEVRLHQIWIIPKEQGLTPRYDQKSIADLRRVCAFL